MQTSDAQANLHRLGDGGHGDFFNGWQQEVLEHAIETCTDPSGVVEKCGAFTFNTVEEYSSCTIEPEVDEDVWGPMAKLPGCNNLRGPDGSVVDSSCSDDTMVSPKPEISKASSTESSKATQTAAGATPASYPSNDEENADHGNDEESADPYVVTVTVTKYEYTHVKTTTTVKAPAAVKTETAPPVCETKYAKRHLHNHGKRHGHHH